MRRFLALGFLLSLGCPFQGSAAPVDAGKINIQVTIDNPAQASGKEILTASQPYLSGPRSSGNFSLSIPKSSLQQFQTLLCNRQGVTASCCSKNEIPQNRGGEDSANQSSGHGPLAVTDSARQHALTPLRNNPFGSTRTAENHAISWGHGSHYSAPGAASEVPLHISPLYAPPIARIAAPQPTPSPLYSLLSIESARQSVIRTAAHIKESFTRWGRQFRETVHYRIDRSVANQLTAYIVEHYKDPAYSDGISCAAAVENAIDHVFHDDTNGNAADLAAVFDGNKKLLHLTKAEVQNLIYKHHSLPRGAIIVYGRLPQQCSSQGPVDGGLCGFNLCYGHTEIVTGQSFDQSRHERAIDAYSDFGRKLFFTGSVNMDGSDRGLGGMNCIADNASDSKPYDGKVSVFIPVKPTSHAGPGY